MLTEFEIQREGKKMKDAQLSQSLDCEPCGLFVGEDEFFMVSELKVMSDFWF